MDSVYIHDLQVNTIIGIYDWERRVRQTVSLDLEMASDIREAAVSENIQHALDYHAVSQRLIEFIEASEFLLLETLAEKIVEIIRDEFAVPWVKLRLGKPGAVPAAKDVGLIIERGVRG